MEINPYLTGDEPTEPITPVEPALHVGATIWATVDITQRMLLGGTNGTVVIPAGAEGRIDSFERWGDFDPAPWRVQWTPGEFWWVEESWITADKPA